MQLFVICLLILIASPLLAFDNILLISIDTLRSDSIGCYGSKKATTPNIDSLAKNGVLFKNVVSPAPFTLPSHTSMMTGLIPPSHGVLDNGGFYLDPNTVTLAEMARSQGLNTAAFVGAFPLDSRFGLDQGFDLYNDNYPSVNNVNELTMPERPAEEVTGPALLWLEAHKAKRWFVFVHFYDPHFPYKDSYEKEIEEADRQVGRLLKFLKDNGLDRKTLVVLTSDHGESLGEHQEKTHGIFAYESTLRTPLIFSPFRPKTIETRVRLIDIAPTILGLQKLSFPQRIQGVSLRNFIEGGTQTIPDSYFESLSLHLNAGWAPLRGFYSGSMKYIELPLQELYDISKDPGESSNLCSDQQLCNLWKTKFSSFYRPYNKPDVKRAEIDRETQEQLRALGYVTGSSARTIKDYTANDDPKNLITFHNRIDAAMSFFNKGYDLKALEILEKIISDRPDYSVAYELASYIQSSLGFPEQSVELLNKAVKNGVPGESIVGKMGLYLYEARRYDEAMKQLRVAVTSDPKNVDQINYLGMTYTAIGNYSAAEESFRKALALDPSSAMTINNLATLFLTQKKYDLAEKELMAAVAVNPRMSGAYNQLGVIHANRKNWSEAIRYWTLALNENKKHYDAMLNLAYAYLESNQKTKALDLLQDFEKNAPRNRYAADLPKVRSLIRQIQ